MHADGRTFDGLYAVGGASGGLEGGARVGYVGGLAKAATTGMLAGEHIVQSLR
jgi:fumarate reductase flavoprotein subunit